VKPTGKAEWNRMADIIERREYFQQGNISVSVFPDIALLQKYKKKLSRVGENITEGKVSRYQVSISSLYATKEHDKTEKI